MYCAHTALTYRWPSSWCLAALWGFIQPVVDAARYACLYHSCFLFGQCQRSAKPGHHWQRGRAGRTSELGSFLSVCPSLVHTHRKFQQLSNILHHLYFFLFLFFYLECAPAASRRAEHVAFLPHALDVSYAVGDHGQIHGSGARGSRLLVLSLRRQKSGFILR